MGLAGRGSILFRISAGLAFGASLPSAQNRQNRDRSQHVSPAYREAAGTRSDSRADAGY